MMASPPKSKSKPCFPHPLGSRRFFFYIVLLLIVVVILIIVRLISETKISFEHLHYVSDQDLELVTVPVPLAAKKEAKCLDGSLPAYFYRPGSASSKFWILHLDPGAWCDTAYDCYKRSLTSRGSSERASTSITYDGIFSKDCLSNPQFCTWNMAVFLYCDGGSFLGNASTPLLYKSTKLYRRGAANFDAILEHLLLTTSLKEAEHVILTGSSAGGTAALIHADRLRMKLPASVHSLHVIIDGSLFVDVADYRGKSNMAALFQRVYDLHHIKNAESIKECTQTKSEEDAWQCLFVSHYYNFVFTPVFFINSAQDTWFRHHALSIRCNHASCPSSQEATVNRSRDSVYDLAQAVSKSEKNGVFFSFCPYHTLLYKKPFFGLKMQGSTVNETLALWLLHSQSQDLPATRLSLLDGVKTC